MRDPVAEFQSFNRIFAKRNPELLRLKVARMAASPFAFFRGTFHLFARDILDRVAEPPSPRQAGEAELDLVGDIHSENYGTYKADDGAVHYDINDFDETTQGRLDFDVRRMATSVLLAAQERNAPLSESVPVVLAFLDAYTTTVQRLMKKGRDLDLDLSNARPTTCPPIDSLLREVAGHKRPAFISKLTTLIDGKRQLVRSLHYFNLPEAEKAQALRLLEDYRKRMPPPSTADFYQPVDVCGRVSGIGSMGRHRYVVLVIGKGSRDARNRLLELKESRPSAYDLHRNRQTDEAALVARAEQVIAMQRASQAVSSSRLGFAVDGGMSFQVRELGPRDQRLDLKTLKNGGELESVAQSQAALLARTHARSAARVIGVANPLAELGDVAAFCQRVLAFALAYADLVRSDWAQLIGRRAELEQCERWS